MRITDYVRYSDAIKMSEKGNFAECRRAYGQDFAGILTVTYFRKKLNDKPDQWPEPDYLTAKVADAFLEIFAGVYEGDIARYQNLVRKLEYDLHEAYFTCRNLFGTELTELALTAILWRDFAGDEEKVKSYLVDKRILTRKERNG